MNTSWNLISSLIISLLFVMVPQSYSKAQESRIWGTYYGGTLSDYANDVITDGSGNVYIVGTTQSTSGIASGGFQNTLGGGQDAFLTKFDSNGNLLWSTYYGGAGSDLGESVAIDASGNVYLLGWTTSTSGIASGGFQNTFGGSADAFLAKFDSNGNLLWSTYYGGVNGDYGNSVAVDVSNNIYIVGNTQSLSGIASGGFQTIFGGSVDAFLVKFDASGNRTWSTYFGSTGTETGEAVTVDASGNIFITGSTTSSSGIFFNGTDATLGNGNDAYLVKFNSAGSRTWSNYVGGDSGSESGYDLAVDFSGNVFLAGTTTSAGGSGLNTTSAFQTSQGGAPGTSDAFLGKYNTSSVPQWCTYYGGTGSDGGTPACCTDALGNVYLANRSASLTNISSGGWQNTNGGGWDAYFVRFSSTGARLASTYYGGASNDYGNGISVDLNGYVYLAGQTSSTTQIGSGGYQNSYAGGTGDDAFLAKFSACSVAPSAPGAISGTTTVCQGSSNTYSITAVAGANYYVWTLPGGWSGTSTTNSITTTAGATSGNITVTANNACGPSASATLAITVNPVPATPASISGTTSICPGSSNTYSITAVGGASSYTWTLPSGWSGTSTTTSITTTSSASSGNITVTANNTCGSSTAATLPITINTIPATPGSISGTTSVCSGSSNTYSLTAVAGATSYTWTLPSGWSGTSTTNSISATANSTGGNITVTASNACGTSATQTLAVTINSVPSTPGSISGTTTICSGSTNTYSISAVAGATSYTWTLPGGWSGTSTTNSITATSDATSGNITVTADNACGSSATSTLAITVTTSSPSIPGSISGNATVCPGSSNTYSIVSVVGATSYTWTLPSGWSGTSTTNSISTAASSTSGNITVTANNVCGSSSASTLPITINTIPNTPGSITGNTAVCLGSNNNYSVTAVPNATSYTWSLPSGWSGTSTTNSITATASSSTGNITITANNSCGSSSSSSLPITAVLTTPVNPGIISGSISICDGSNNTYTIIPAGDASTYNWTLPSGWSGSSTNSSINTTSGTIGGLITVTGTNFCGTSTPANLTVTVNTIPATPGTISGASPICEGTSNNYSVSAVSGATSYTWSLPSGWSGTSTTNSITTTSSSTSGNITVTANNSCGNSSATTLSIAVNALPNVGLVLPTDLLCVYNSSLALSGGTPTGGTFTGTGVSTGNFNPTTAGTGTFTITYTFTDANSCTNTATDNIVVDACLGVDQNQNESYKLYPNPTAGVIHFESNITSEFKLSVRNLIGELILSHSVNSGSFLIDLTEFENGLYFLQIENGMEMITEKIVKN